MPGLRQRAATVSTVLRESAGASWSSVRNGVTEGVAAGGRAVRTAPRALQQYTVESARYYRAHPISLAQEIVSGATIAVLQIPESVAFAFVAGLDPIFGLRATVFLGFICGLTGARPAMVSGAAGAMAVVLADLSGPGGRWLERPKEDVEALVLWTVLLTGAFQLGIGGLGLARAAKLIPFTAMIGFMNGLAIIILISQLNAFKECSGGRDYAVCARANTLTWMSISDGRTWMVALEGILAAALVLVMPYFTRIKRYVPGALVALVVVTVFEHTVNRRAINLPTRTVEETAPISGEFVAPSVPRVVDDPDWSTVAVYGLIMALVGAVESIMTAEAVAELLQKPLGSFGATQETLSQGLGNFLCALLGSMGGDAMIGQSTVNVMNGAKGRLSTTSAGVILAIIVLALSSAIGLVPVACLFGILLVIVMKTFYWPTFLLLFQLNWTDSLAIVMVTVLAVLTNLAVAIGAGVVWRALVHAYASADLLRMTNDMEKPKEPGVKHYYVCGPLFFGSTKSFRTSFTPAVDPPHVVLDFHEAMVVDFSGVTAIRSVCKRYQQLGKTVTVRGLSAISRAHVRRHHKLRGYAEASAEAEALLQGRSLYRPDTLDYLQIFSPQGEMNHPGEEPTAEDILQGLLEDGVHIEEEDTNSTRSREEGNVSGTLTVSVV